MRHSKIHFAVSIALGVSLALSSAAHAESVMKICGDQWKQAKAAGAVNGETWPQYLAQCRAQQNSGSTAPAPTTYQPAPAPVPVAPGAAPVQGQSIMKTCAGEWANAKAMGTTQGATWPQFLAQCRTQHASAEAPATTPAKSWWMPGATQAPAAAPAPTPTPALANNQAAPHQPAPTANRAAPAATGAGEFQTEQQAKYRCPSDTIVWVNTKSRVFHYAGTRYYGATENGAYMCEADAINSGDRAAPNERRP